MQREIYELLTTTGGTYTAPEIASIFNVRLFVAYRALKQMSKHIDSIHCIQGGPKYHSYMLFWYEKGRKKEYYI